MSSTAILTAFNELYFVPLEQYIAGWVFEFKFLNHGMGDPSLLIVSCEKSKKEYNM